MNRSVRITRFLPSLLCHANGQYFNSFTVKCLIPTSRSAMPSNSFAQTCVNFCTQSSLSKEVRADLDSKVQKDKVVLFMKGNPEEPMCGFSRAVCLVLKMHEIPFVTYDVLQDEALRQGIKEYSNWPTIPQLYIGGEFVGGCDIIVEMHQNKEIVEFFKSHGLKSKYDS